MSTRRRNRLFARAAVHCWKAGLPTLATQWWHASRRYLA